MPTPSTPTTKPKSNKSLVWLFLTAGLLAAAVFFAYPHITPQSSTSSESNHTNAVATPDNSSAASVIRLSQQARANLGLLNGKVEIGSYWKKIQTTGIIADRPGFTDRNVTSPVDCVVTKVHAMEGDIVRPGDILFTLRIVSEYLQQAQSSYFKAFKEIDILRIEIKRIENLANLGVIPEKRIIALKQDITRQQVELDAHRQELLARGFNEEQLSKIASGQFIASIEVVAPQQTLTNKRKSKIKQISFPTVDNQRNTFLEVQELNVQLGQQIKAGELLAVLANHNYLYIKGHAFKKEAANISRAAENDWNVEVEFVNDASSDWKPFTEPLQIRHLSNTIDTANRTFDFFIPLNNQSRIYEKEGETFVVWRFRPGQRVRIHVPAERMQDVIVVPSQSVIYDGPDAYVFQQNGDLYDRIAVNVLHRDRLNTVIANDGTLLPGFFIAKNSAASLNRILKVQAASEENTGNFHVHADGSVHANH